MKKLIFCKEKEKNEFFLEPLINLKNFKYKTKKVEGFKNMLREVEIIKELKKGKLDNFEFIFNKYYKKVYYISLKILKDVYQAEELTQEVFIDVLKCIHNLKYDEYFGSWVVKITLNKANGKLRNLISEKTIISNNAIDERFSKTESYIPEKYILKREINDVIQKEINSLDSKKKNVLILFYFYNLSLKEIANIEQVPVGTVKSRLFSAKKLLNDKMIKKKIISIFLVFNLIPNIDLNVIYKNNNMIYTYNFREVCEVKELYT